MEGRVNRFLVTRNTARWYLLLTVAVAPNLPVHADHQQCFLAFAKERHLRQAGVLLEIYPMFPRLPCHLQVEGAGDERQENSAPRVGLQLPVLECRRIGSCAGRRDSFFELSPYWMVSSFLRTRLGAWADDCSCPMKA